MLGLSEPLVRKLCLFLLSAHLTDQLIWQNLSKEKKPIFKTTLKV